jgi:hypothetical protein
MLAAFFVPVFFVVMQRPSERQRGSRATPLPKPSPEPAAAAEPEAVLVHLIARGRPQ